MSFKSIARVFGQTQTVNALFFYTLANMTIAVCLLSRIPSASNANVFTLAVLTASAFPGFKGVANANSVAWATECMLKTKKELLTNKTLTVEESEDLRCAYRRNAAIRKKRARMLPYLLACHYIMLVAFSVFVFTVMSTTCENCAEFKFGAPFPEVAALDWPYLAIYFGILSVFSLLVNDQFATEDDEELDKLDAADLAANAASTTIPSVNKDESPLTKRVVASVDGADDK